ncbi:L,D-transpeptidase [Portibacter lacus]|uniref:L,D-TPase catalytic domain-containing protein n=1 Tax=Portibacter lacus TaxID=1099794 RepID=A0AA37WCE2_9BACT|nr:L,D-transpeptidase [Portibacter lacus]GLR16406.1 hypothetical protein GCM10007940_10210 [Portibacter lacus]
MKKQPTILTYLRTFPQHFAYRIIVLLMVSALISCRNEPKQKINESQEQKVEDNHIPSPEIIIEKPDQTVKVIVVKDVPIREYFKWMDSLVNAQNQENNYTIDEYIVVKANPWIIDTLAHTDYYYLKEKGIFNEDSQSLLALQKGQTLIIPDSSQTESLRNRMANTYIDVNIPEYKLRIIENGKVLYTFPTRVGQNTKRYLEMAKTEVDLRTKPGIGKIVRVNKAPQFINPKDNRRYYVTNRDDKKVTKLPLIPWIEPEVNGQRYGQLIHPTTNIATLGKAYSNGCIGLRESDSWIVYYYAPLNTKVVIRYDLQGKDEEGNDIKFANIYPGFEKKSYQKEAIEAGLQALDGKAISVCDCRATQ